MQGVRWKYVVEALNQALRAEFKNIGFETIEADTQASKPAKNAQSLPSTNPTTSDGTKPEDIIEAVQKLTEEGTTDIRQGKTVDGEKKFEAAISRISNYSEVLAKTMDKSARPNIDRQAKIFTFMVYIAWSDAFRVIDSKKAEEYSLKAGDSIKNLYRDQDEFSLRPVFITLRQFTDGTQACVFHLDGRAFKDPEELYNFLESKKADYGTGTATKVPALIRPIEGTRWKWIATAYNQAIRANFEYIGVSTFIRPDTSTRPSSQSASVFYLDDAPKVSLYGLENKAWQVVYVIDRSGAMINTFDYLHKELLTSIGKLQESQDFHLIFWDTGVQQENSPKQLIPADKKNKTSATEFVKSVFPTGQTDPIPAMTRAFEVLKDDKKSGKVIFFLTDGLLPDNQAMLKLIAKENPAGENQVIINTLLYGTRNKEAEEVLQKIAKENKGKYKYVNPEAE